MTTARVDVPSSRVLVIEVSGCVATVPVSAVSHTTVDVRTGSAPVVMAHADDHTNRASVRGDSDNATTAPVSGPVCSASGNRVTSMVKTCCVIMAHVCGVQICASVASVINAVTTACVVRTGANVIVIWMSTCVLTVLVLSWAHTVGVTAGRRRVTAVCVPLVASRIRVR